MVTLMRKDLVGKILTALMRKDLAKTRKMTNKLNNCQISLFPSKGNRRKQSSLGSIQTILTAFLMMQVSPPVCPTLIKLVRSNLRGRESEKTAREGTEGSRGRKKADLANCSKEHRVKEERPKACHPSQQPRGEKRINSSKKIVIF